MTPLSVFRIWGLGLFSWALLGLGIYLAYEAYDHFDRPPVLARSIEVRDGGEDLSPSDSLDNARDLDALGVDRTDVGSIDSVDRTLDGVPPRSDDTAVHTAGQDWEGYALLAGAIACLGMSLIGYWPISLFLGNSTGHAAQEITPSETTMVSRPDGSQLHVEIYGDASKPTMLLTHGWSLDTSAWNYMKADLIANHRVVAWDLPGLGKSQGPANADYSLEKMAADLEAVMQATTHQAPVVLVGHSIGGMILQTFCRLYPEHLGTTVKGLALVHTTYTNPLRTITASGLFTALEKPLVVPLNYMTIALSPLAWLSNWQSYLNGSLHIWTRIVSFAGHQSRSQVDHGARLAAHAWPATVARGNLAMLKFDAQATLPNVHVPVLVVASAHDRVTRPEASQRIERLLPNDRPVVVDAGHLGHWEQAKQVADALNEFGQHVTRAIGSDATSADRPAMVMGHNSAS